MIIAEFTLDHPILRETLNRHPGLRITWEHSYRTSDDHMQMIFWAEGSDFEAVESTMSDDSSVAAQSVLAEVGDRHLYRVNLVGESRETSIMPLLVDVGGVQQQLTATHDGWQNRVRFPNREAFERVYRFCRGHDIDFTFDRIYEQSDRFGQHSPEMTEAQHETLVEAVDSGYLAIPRQCSLAELGERLGVSESAASERFRRSVKTLVEQTVYT